MVHKTMHGSCPTPSLFPLLSSPCSLLLPCSLPLPLLSSSCPFLSPALACASVRHGVALCWHCLWAGSRQEGHGVALGRPWAGSVHWRCLGGLLWAEVVWAGLGWVSWLSGWLWMPACIGSLTAWVPACLGTIPAWAPACQEGWTLVRLSEEAIRAISTA